MLKILLSNDDGFDAIGINILYEELNKIAEVCVIAPEINQSGAGSSITTKRPLKAESYGKNCFKVNGTPADCVFLGLKELCPFIPDLVVTGINEGANMAEDLLYSGTVGAAFEGMETSLPCLAISACHKQVHGIDIEPNFKTAALVAIDILQNISSQKINPQITLNINVPNLEYSELKGIAESKLGSWGIRNPPHVEIKSNGKTRYWVSHRSGHPQNDEDTDIMTVERGVVSVTPIKPNFLYTEKRILDSWLN